MTDQEHLERAYRRLLAWYPRAFRDENGPEMLAVLLACAADGRRRPGLAQAADLIRGGLRMRLFPSVPRSAPTVRAAVRLMYAGAAVTVLSLVGVVISLPYLGRGVATLRAGGRTLPFPVAVAVGIMLALVMTALWLWMARANGHGRSWARVLSTVLVGLGTLHLFGNTGAVQVAFALATWVIGLVAVWLLWRPTSSTFFQQQRRTHTPGQGSV
jgi:hypothetical protein